MLRVESRHRLDQTMEALLRLESGCLAEQCMVSAPF
jgi:hypothetical protein